MFITAHASKLLRITVSVTRRLTVGDLRTRDIHDTRFNAVDTLQRTRVGAGCLKVLGRIGQDARVQTTQHLNVFYTHC